MANDEARLIQLAQKGDARACAALYDRHYDAVYRYCYYRLGDVPTAQDLAGEVFVRMVEKLDTYRLNGRPLLAWLYTIAHNLVVDLYRHRSKAAHLPLDEATDLHADDGADLEQILDRSLEARSLAAAMECLTEEQRQVILLKFIQDLNNAQVARLMGKSEGAVKALQHRALAALRRAWEKREA